LVDVNMSRSKNPLIIAEHIKAGYGETVVLQDVSMTLAEGEIRAVLGTSGCGKSTLMNNILGLEHPMDGKITYLGEEVNIAEGLTENMLEHTGVVFQNGALLSSLTVGENVALPLMMHKPDLPGDVIQDMVAQKLNLVHMLHAFHKYPAELSGGMRKRAALARAVINDPKVLFCDEPSAGLDPVTSRSLDEQLLFMRDELGVGIMIVTHELDSIKLICDSLLFLEKGYVLLDGTLSEAQESDHASVREFFAREQGEKGADKTTFGFHFAAVGET